MLNDDPDKRPPEDALLQQFDCWRAAEALDAMAIVELLEFELALFIGPPTLRSCGSYFHWWSLMEGCNKKPRTAKRDGVLVAKLVKLLGLSGPPTESTLT
ncbi:hypothetical protein [Burkholderia ambifaria]|nr:hypothetical protein [Burkholderia ambifaria]